MNPNVKAETRSLDDIGGGSVTTAAAAAADSAYANCDFSRTQQAAAAVAANCSQQQQQQYFDPDPKMSSYQFVNTLAQCYAEQNAGQNAAAAAGQDYYNMNYPNSYSPNLAAHAQQYGQYSQLMMGQGAANNAAAAAATMVSPIRMSKSAPGVSPWTSARLLRRPVIIWSIT